MLDLLWLIPSAPLAGFIALAFTGAHLPRRAASLVGAGTVGISAAAAALVGVGYALSPEPGAHVQVLWSWIALEGFSPRIALYLDGLSLLMVLVITWVGFLIHLYSVEFMATDEGLSRFFAYMNLFVSAMLILVLADNLLLLYLGWEGVGLSSYLLIGFWYRDPANGRAARKAFLVTRVGDTAMAVGIFLVVTSLGTLDIQEVIVKAGEQWPVGSVLAVAAAALFLCGALGKSAQLPLQTWLPDAMAGPTPVSALIHAATMVTAGVYLIARTDGLFALAPAVQEAVAVIGALTLLLAGLSALTQRDIKRVLAYSTISQIGYMFLALGVGAWQAAMFHFMTHAFFKALLFLSAGVVILACDHEHDIFKMGGLRRELPLPFWCFVAGAASLAALPFVTAGFYSKDLILHEALSSDQGSLWLWLAGVTGAVVTALYAARVVFVAFLRPAKTEIRQRPGVFMKFPLVVLAALSLAGGFLDLPGMLGHHKGSLAPETMGEVLLQFLTSMLTISAVLLAYLLFLHRPFYAERLAASRAGGALHALWYAGWGFDRVYDAIFVRPFVWVSSVNREDAVDLPFRGAAWYGSFFSAALGRTQSGRVRWYAMGIALGAVVFMGVVVLL
jgi:NADH-quinone oxidoreductase subunit L